MQKIVVALTSYPKRINIVHEVIESLWKQKVCADEIILYLCSMEFLNKEAELPKELLFMIGKNGFKIEWVEENLKSHKKYYYALQQYSENIVITVDDDVKYAETLISDLIENYQRFPNSISARRARMIQRGKQKLLPYSEWNNYVDEYFESPRMDLCAIGVGGILYPPHCASDKWFEQEKIFYLAGNQDDLWLKYNEIVDKIPIAYIKPSENDVPIEIAKETALGIKNLYYGENDLCIERLIKYTQNNSIEIFEKWFANLLTKEEYYLKIENYYFSFVRKKFCEIGATPIYIYGAGKLAITFLGILSECQLLSQIKAIVVSDKQNNPAELLGVEVIQLEEMDETEQFSIILCVGNAYLPEIEEKLKDYYCQCYNLEIPEMMQYYK